LNSETLLFIAGYKLGRWGLLKNTLALCFMAWLHYPSGVGEAAKLLHKYIVITGENVVSWHQNIKLSLFNPPAAAISFAQIAAPKS
jgi:hypothetical protein